jgi:LysM repeat protein
MSRGSGTFAYIIQPEDALVELAERYNTSTEAIFIANPGVDLNYLVVGQVINVPGDPPSAIGRKRRAELDRKRREELQRRRREDLERRRRQELEHRRKGFQH